MSYYFIGPSDPRNPGRWTYQTSVKSTSVIIRALRDAGFQVTVRSGSESISPFLDELEISKPDGSRDELEEVCESVDPTRTAPPAAPSRARPGSSDEFPRRK
jgi:hypothetical protein